MVCVVSISKPCVVLSRVVRGEGVNQRAVRVQRGQSAVRGAEKEEESDSGFFSNNTRAGIGYVDSDSAGQTNIFAVEAKTYVQGSAMDDTTGAQANTNFALTAAGLAIGALGVAALTNTVLSPTSSEDIYVEGQYKALTAYRQQFAQETGLLVAAAPKVIAEPKVTPEPEIVSEVVPEPELQ